MEKIRGVIQRIVYKNNENGFCIVNIKINFKNKDMEKYKDLLISNSLSVTAYYDNMPIVGEEIEYFGEFKESNYGLQLNAKSYKRSAITSKDAIVNYLASDYFPGVGVNIASKIFNALGDNCLKLIKEEKSVLDKVEINEDLKNTIYDCLIKYEKNENTVLSFISMGFTNEIAKKIQNELDMKEVDIALKNPYYLIDRIRNLGFIKVDKIALENGFEKNSPLRLEACFYYFLNNYIHDSGHTYIEYDNMRSLINDHLREEFISKEQFESITATLVSSGKIIIDQNNFIYESYIYKDELNLASIILSMIDTKAEFEKTKILEMIKKSTFKYTEKQEKAICNAICENISIVTGGPGTGKTTIIKGILEILRELKGNTFISEYVNLLAPTGRAAKRITEMTNKEATTIHRFLGYDGIRFLYNDKSKRESKFIIVDEVSMIDISLMAKLFSALEHETKVVLVGDVNQIPSIGPGEVLSNLIDSKIIYTTLLDKIHRQDAQSSIIDLAFFVNEGYLPENILEKQIDRSFIERYDNQILHPIASIVQKAIDKGMNILKDIQILIPMYKGDVGIDRVNSFIQEIVNPKNGDEVLHFNKIFRINDKVIQLVNRYNDSIMNGDIGFVHSFIYTNTSITGIIVQYESNQVAYTKEQFEEISLAYAISIHKSQGSEFDTVIIPLSKKYYPMLKRKLYYTAITRAKKALVMIGSVEALKIAASSLGEKRKTRLKEYLNSSLDNRQKSLNPYDFM